MGAGSLLSYVGLFTESTSGFLAVMGLVALVVGYLIWEWRAAGRDIAAEMDEKRARRRALGVPEWKPDAEES